MFIHLFDFEIIINNLELGKCNPWGWMDQSIKGMLLIDFLTLLTFVGAQLREEDM